MIGLLLQSFRRTFRSRAALQAENLALRHQLAVLRQRLGRRRLRLRATDRLLWIALSRVWPGWREALTIVQPATVVGWHRRMFTTYWRWKSRPGGGRPRVDAEIRELIARMARENPIWGAPRIHGELLMLGFRVSEATVSRYLRRDRRRPPSQTWRTFLCNHLHQSIAVDFMVVPTIRFSLLYVCVVLDHGRRRILHIAVTAHPTAEWTAQQLTEALPWESSARFLIRDNDSIFGNAFRSRAAGLGLREVVTARGSPWQNGYCERVLGTVRRECTDHVIAVSERQVPRVVRAYAAYYNRTRTHLSLAKDAPEHRVAAGHGVGPVTALPEVGGLHHRYERLAA